MSDDWRCNSAIVAIIDVALLGLIRAHDGKGTEGERLRSAKKALFGIDPPRGKPVDHDIPELLFMAREYAAERGVPAFDGAYTPYWPDADESNCRSKTALAEEALAARLRVDPKAYIHSHAEKVRNLEKKFTAQRDGLLRLVVGWGAEAHDDIMGSQLRDLKVLMELLGIPFAVPSRPSRDSNSLD